MNDNIRSFPNKEREIELTLLKTADSALSRIVERTRLTEMEAINVAIQVYDIVSERLARGDDVVFRHPDRTTSKLELPSKDNP